MFDYKTVQMSELYIVFSGWEMKVQGNFGMLTNL